MAPYAYFHPAIKLDNPVDRERFTRPPDVNVDLSGAADILKRLISDGAPEDELHMYFERYPQLLPGFSNYHNGPIGRVVVSKFRLGPDFISDFAFFAYNSMETCLTLIEIESPRLGVFTKDGEFTSAYTRARQQVIDWMTWVHKNKKDALRCFGRLSTGIHRQNSLQCVAYLVVGNSADFDTPTKMERWSAESPTYRPVGIRILSYNRILSVAQDPYWYYSKRLLICGYRGRDLYLKHIANGEAS